MTEPLSKRFQQLSTKDLAFEISTLEYINRILVIKNLMLTKRLESTSDGLEELAKKVERLAEREQPPARLKGLHD